MDPERQLAKKTAKASSDAAVDLFHGYVAFQSSGVIRLPAAVRDRLHADEPGAQIEVIEREPGVFELRGVLPVDADQRWFWEERWQRMEREADADVAAGRVTVADSPEELLRALKR